MITPFQTYCKQEGLNYRRKVTSDLVREIASWPEGKPSILPYEEIFTDPNIFLNETPKPGKSRLELSSSLSFERFEFEAPFVDSLRNKYVTYPQMNEEELVQLQLLRQSVREDFARYPALLTEVWDKIIGSLKVWVHLTAEANGYEPTDTLTLNVNQYIHKRGKLRGSHKGVGRFVQAKSVLSDLITEYKPEDVLCIEAASLWHRTAQGYKNASDHLWNQAMVDDLNALCDVFSTPKIIVSPTHDALQEHVPAVRELFDKLLPLDVKLSTYDRLIHKATSSSEILVDKDGDRIDEISRLLLNYIPSLRRPSKSKFINRLSLVADLLLKNDFNFSENQTLYKKIEAIEFEKSGRKKEHGAKNAGGNIRKFFNTHLKKAGIGLLHGKEDFTLLGEAYKRWKRLSE